MINDITCLFSCSFFDFSTDLAAFFGKSFSDTGWIDIDCLIFVFIAFQMFHIDGFFDIRTLSKLHTVTNTFTKISIIRNEIHRFTFIRIFASQICCKCNIHLSIIFDRKSCDRTFREVKIRIISCFICQEKCFS